MANKMSSLLLAEEKNRILTQTYLKLNDEGRDALDMLIQKLADEPDEDADSDRQLSHAGLPMDNQNKAGRKSRGGEHIILP